MSQTYKNRTVGLAEKLQANLEFGGDPFEVFVEAPKGKYWAWDPFHGLHELFAEREIDESEAAVWRDVYERMQAGLRDCPPDCEA